MSLIIQILTQLLIIIGLLILVEFVLFIVRLGWSGISMIYDYKIKKNLPKGFSRNQGSSFRILVVGDSSAIGGQDNFEDSLAGRLSLRFNADVFSLAHYGFKVKDVIEQIGSVQGQDYDLVLIQALNNDIVRFTNLDRLRREIPAMFDLAKKIGKRVIIFRGGNLGNFPFFPLSVRWFFTRRSRKVRDICMGIAKEKGVLYVEKWMERKDDIFLKDPHHYYTPDLIHLNGEGYRVWFDHLMSEMARNRYQILTSDSEASDLITERL